MSIFSEGTYVRLRHHWDLPSSEWGIHGIIVRTRDRTTGQFPVVIVKWDDPRVVGRFVATDFLEISDKHTLWLGDYGVFPQEKTSRD